MPRGARVVDVWPEMEGVNRCSSLKIFYQSEQKKLTKRVAELEAEIEEWRHNQDMCFKTAEEDGKKIKQLEAQQPRRRLIML